MGFTVKKGTRKLTCGGCVVPPTQCEEMKGSGMIWRCRRESCARSHPPAPVPLPPAFLTHWMYEVMNLASQCRSLCVVMNLASQCWSLCLPASRLPVVFPSPPLPVWVSGISLLF